jgi:hypothetical protein
VGSRDLSWFGSGCEVINFKESGQIRLGCLHPLSFSQSVRLHPPRISGDEESILYLLNQDKNFKFCGETQSIIPLDSPNRRCIAENRCLREAAVPSMGHAKEGFSTNG